MRSRLGGRHGRDRRGLLLAAHQKRTGHSPLSRHVDDGLPAHTAVESEIPRRVEETQGEVAGARVGPPRPEVEHGSPRPGPAGLDHPAPGLPKGAGDPGLPSCRSRLQPEEHAGPARSHVRLDQEPRPTRAARTPAGRPAARRGLPSDGPRGRASTAPLGAGSRRSAGVNRRADSGRPRYSSSPFWLNSPATPGRIAPASKRSRKLSSPRPAGVPRSSSAEIAVDDIDGHVPEPHSASSTPEIGDGTPLGGDPGVAERRDQARDLAVAVDRGGILHEGHAAKTAPPQPARGGLDPPHDERQEIGRVGESLRLAGRVHTGEDLRAQDADARGVVVQSRERRGVGLEEDRRERAVRPRFEADVGTDHELPGCGRAC